MDTLATALVASAPPTEDFFQAQFAISLTGLLLLQPVWAPDHSVVQDFTYVRLNPAAQRSLGLPEYPGITMLTRYPHTGPTAIFEFYREAFRSGQPSRRAVHYPHDGLDSYFWLAAQRSGDYLVVSFADVAELSQLAAQALPASLPAPTRPLPELGRRGPAAIAVFEGPDHRCQLANAGYQRLVGGQPLLGRSLREAAPELAGQPLLNWLDEVYRTGQPLLERELVVPATHGPTDPAAATRLTLYVQPTQDAAGQVAGVVVVAYDTSDEAKNRQHLRDLNAELVLLNVELSATGQQLSATAAQLASSQQQVRQLTRSFDARVQERVQNLEAANEQLARTNRDLDYFVYSASHDLRAPIANLEGLLNELDRVVNASHPLRPEVQPLLTLMHGAVQRFQQTIGHLTDISRVGQAGSAPTEALDVAAIVAGVQLDLAPLIAQTGAHVAVEVGSCAPLRLAAKHLRAVVYNLLSNALKYRAPGRAPDVHISCHATGAAAELRVQDNGLGLSPEQQAQLFTLFHRLHHHVEGSGVGLYLIKKMVENAGGTLTVRSEPGVGSTFTASLPLD